MRARIAPTERCDAMDGVAVQRADGAAASRRRARSDGAAHGRRRRTCRALQHRARPVALRPDAGQRRASSRARAVLSAVTVAKMTTPSTPAGMRERARPRLGHRLVVLVEPRRALPDRLVRSHRIHRHVDLDRSRRRASYVIFLSSRLHPDGKGDVTPLRARVATVAAAATRLRTGASPPAPADRQRPRMTGTDFGASLHRVATCVHPTARC